MRYVPAFWDASALVPLCIHERATAAAQSYLRRYALVVWWGSIVEVYSAICRLHRQKQLTDAEKQGATARLKFLTRAWREILPGDQIRESAAASLDRFELRAADAVQLAASLTWCDQRPRKRIFISSDHRLSAAARSAGFSVLHI